MSRDDMNRLSAQMQRDLQKGEKEMEEDIRRKTG
jgi:hypothetical protein